MGIHICIRLNYAYFLTNFQEGTFFSILGFESWLVTLSCAGLAPWGGIGLTILSAVCVGPLKLIGAAIQWNFRRIVRNCNGKK